MQFPEIVTAARQIGADKRALAEALFNEIPPRAQGRPVAGTTTVAVLLEAAAAEILTETGEQYEVKTLSIYRDVAVWITTGNPLPGEGVFTWADASWTAHREAFGAGVPFAKFAAAAAEGKVTKRDARTMAGRPRGDTIAAARAINERPAEARKLVDRLTPEARKAVAREVKGRETDTHVLSPDAQEFVDKVDATNRAAKDAGEFYGILRDLRVAVERLNASAADLSESDRAALVNVVNEIIVAAEMVKFALAEAGVES
jgi:hypothetical protein